MFLTIWMGNISFSCSTFSSVFTTLFLSLRCVNSLFFDLPNSLFLFEKCCFANSIACLTLYPAEPLHAFGLTDKASAYSLSVAVPDIMCKAQAGTGSFPLESAMLTESFLQYANMFLQTSSIPVEINPSAFKNLLTTGS